jgi:hypothetical protein
MVQEGGRVGGGEGSGVENAGVEGQLQQLQRAVKRKRNVKRRTQRGKPETICPAARIQKRMPTAD